MSDIQVRFATLKDAADVAQLHLIAAMTLYEGQVPFEHWAATPMPKRVSYWKEAMSWWP
jgi:hypothetical protein